MLRFKKFFFTTIYNFCLFLILIIGIQNSNNKSKVYFLNNETIDLDFSSSGHDKLFYDVIYNPYETRFLKMGKQLGYKTENGKTMFIYQALEAFKLWHRIEPKVNKDTFKLLDND